MSNLWPTGDMWPSQRFHAAQKFCKYTVILVFMYNKMATSFYFNNNLKLTVSIMVFSLFSACYLQHVLHTSTLDFESRHHGANTSDCSVTV